MKDLLKFFILCQVILLLFSAQFVLSQEINLDAGEQVFSQTCSACHANGRNVLAQDKTLDLDMLESMGLDNVNAIIKQVTYGKNDMPAFGDVLSDDDIKNVANYVLSKSKAGW